jgi:hypothetical protein
MTIMKENCRKRGRIFHIDSMPPAKVNPEKTGDDRSQKENCQRRPTIDDPSL